MFNVRLARDHLYGKWLFTWLSLVISLVVSCLVLSFFPRDVLDEIWNLIESAPEDFSYLLFHVSKLNATIALFECKLNHYLNTRARLFKTNKVVS